MYQRLERNADVPKACIRSYHYRKKNTHRWIIQLNGAAHRQYIRGHFGHAEILFDETKRVVALKLYRQKTRHSYKITALNNGYCQIAAASLATRAKLPKAGTAWCDIVMDEGLMTFQLLPINELSNKGRRS